MLRVEIATPADVLERGLTDLRARGAETISVGPSGCPLIPVQADVPSAQFCDFPRYPAWRSDGTAICSRCAAGYEPVPGEGWAGQAGRPGRPHPSQPPTLAGYAEAIPESTLDAR